MTDFYFRSPDEMQKLFAEVPDALYNTVNILEMTDVQLKLGEPILPHFEVPDGYHPGFIPQAPGVRRCRENVPRGASPMM